jgi:hypothetical protein
MCGEFLAVHRGVTFILYSHEIKVGRWAAIAQGWFGQFLLALWRHKLVRADPHEAAIRDGINDHAQSTVIVVSERDETEWLQYPITSPAQRIQHLGHSLHRTRLRLEGNFDEVSLVQGLGEPQ